MSREPEPEEVSVVGVSLWRRPGTVDCLCSSATPCCDATVRVRAAELNLVGQASVACPACAKGWQVRFDPSKPSHDALWMR